MQIELTDDELAFLLMAVRSFTISPTITGLFQKIELTKKLGIESLEDFNAFRDRLQTKLTP